MSALATILAVRGHPVSGSDPRENATTLQLKALGVTVFSEQSAKGINSLLASATQSKPVVVTSTAIPDSNPELLHARDRGLEIWHRSDLLAALIDQQPTIAVAGSHGKTTTSTLITTLLLQAGEDAGLACSVWPHRKPWQARCLSQRQQYHWERWGWTSPTWRRFCNRLASTLGPADCL